MASYGERELIVGSTIAGMFRVVSLSALPALGHSLAVGVGCTLNELSEQDALPGVPLIGYQLVNLAGELRMTEQGPIVGGLRWGGDNHWVGSGRHSFETQVTLVCDLSAHVLDRIEEARAGAAPVFWMKLWPTLLCDGKLVQASVHAIRLEVPRDVYLSALEGSRVESRRVIEVRIPAADALRFTRALSHLQDAQRKLDEGQYNEVAITSRKAMEALAGEMGEDVRHAGLIEQIKAKSDSNRAEAVSKLLAGTRHLAALAGHDLGGAVTFTRAEAVLAYRLTQELLVFCSAMTNEG